MIDVVYSSQWPRIELQFEKSGGNIVRQTFIAGPDRLNYHQIGVGNKNV